MPQVIDGSKKNFNTTVVGASVTVVAQYAVRTAYNRQYYANSRVYEFNNRPVWGENILSFVTPLVLTDVRNIRLTVTGTNNYLLLTGTTLDRVKVSTQTSGYSTATKYFITGTNTFRLPINSLSGGVATVSTFTAIVGTPNIYGVALITTATWAFAIEQLPASQTSGLAVNSIITVNTSSGNTGNFGTDNTAYVYAINSNQIIVVATSGTTTPVNGTIDGITNTGQTFYIAPTPPLVGELLVVGGGGSGGNHNTTNGNGGGGAGGLLYASSLTLTGSYDVVVGSGGVAIANSTNSNGNKGGNSSFGIYIAQGGGQVQRHATHLALQVLQPPRRRSRARPLPAVPQGPAGGPGHGGLRLYPLRSRLARARHQAAAGDGALRQPRTRIHAAARLCRAHQRDPPEEPRQREARLGKPH